MTPERWKQVDQLLQEALEREPAERAAFLAEACGRADDLRREVESLLGFHGRAESFIEAPPARMAAALLAERESRDGQTIGPYEIIREIGRGGMGKVYLARDTRLGRQVALKLLPPRFTKDAQRVRRLRQEARVASALNHPNIIIIYEIGEVNTANGALHFIATEFIEGRTLGALIRSGEVKLSEALEVVMQAAGALSAAHAAGIVHRDIKPENIMLRPDGYVKVLDFGLAKLNEHPANEPTRSDKVETDPGTILGTVSYMSPEQARGLETDARSDIFSLGVVLYEMITGRRPFEGETTADVIAALLGKEPPPLAMDASSASGGLQRLIDRMLSKDCAGRFQTAEELRRAIKALKRELGTPGDYTTREFNSLARLARRLGFAGADDVTALDTTESPAPTTSSVSLLFGWFVRSPLRKAIALATLAVALTGGILGWRWLDLRGAPVNSIAALPVTSIAVLPFVNVGNDPQMEYLPDGITESLIGSLSQLPNLSVMARGTVFTYKGRDVDPRRVGDDLKVRAVVTGRVRRKGERLIIRAELADATTGVRLWGDDYEFPMADLLTVEREITHEIREALRPQLGGAKQRSLAKRQSANSEAYRLYLLGRHAFLQANPESGEKALAYFKQAIALDPNFALAHAGVSDVYSAISAQILPPSEAMPNAREAALTAIRLDETLPEAHYSMAMVKIWGDWDRAGAEREFKRAIELNPNFVLAHAQYGSLLPAEGRFEEALSEARRAQELDPRSHEAGNAVGRILFVARRYDEAVIQFRMRIDMDPNNAGARLYLGRVLSQQGKHQEAISESRRAFEISRHHSFRSWLAHVYARAGRRNEALKLLRELETLSRQERVSPVYFARIYVGLGDRERALTWLQKAYDEHSDHVLGISVDPAYDPLRSDPRFIKMLRGIGLAP
jgi:eukaryotic-like serine/threonine-protein kinase